MRVIHQLPRGPRPFLERGQSEWTPWLPRTRASEANVRSATMPLTYRARFSSNIWHFCRNCPDWPTRTSYGERTLPPLPAWVCRRCRKMALAQTCHEASSSGDERGSGTTVGSHASARPRKKKSISDR